MPSSVLSASSLHCFLHDIMVPSHDSHNEKLGSVSERPKTANVSRIGDCLTAKTRFTKRKPKNIDVTNLSADELCRLRKEDPFMYYSIPVATRLKLFAKDIDASGLEMSCSRPRAGQKRAPSLTVTRRSCISFECDPLLLLEDLMDGADWDPPGSIVAACVEWKQVACEKFHHGKEILHI